METGIIYSWPGQAQKMLIYKLINHFHDRILVRLDVVSGACMPKRPRDRQNGQHVSATPTCMGGSMSTIPGRNLRSGEGRTLFVLTEYGCSFEPVPRPDATTLNGLLVFRSRLVVSQTSCEVSSLFASEFSQSIPNQLHFPGNSLYHDWFYFGYKINI